MFIGGMVEFPAEPFTAGSSKESTRFFFFYNYYSYRYDTVSATLILWEALPCCSGLLNNECIFFDSFFSYSWSSLTIWPIECKFFLFVCLLLLCISVPPISRTSVGAWKPANGDFCVASARGGCGWGSQWKSQIWPNAQRQRHARLQDSPRHR